MLKSGIAMLLLLVPGSVQAYTQCNSKQLAGPGAHIAEEGANPVTVGNYVYAAFAKDNNIGVAVSSDLGRTLGAPVLLDDGVGPDSAVRLAAGGDSVYALWVKRRADGIHSMFAPSHNHGQTWDAAIDLGLKRPSTLPQLSADGANVHAAYLTSDGNVTVRNSSDGGRTFSTPVAIAPAGAEIVITSLGQDVYLAWGIRDPRIDVIFAASHDGGRTFKVQNLTTHRPHNANEPIFALDRTSGRLSLVWREDGPFAAVYVQSLDGGNTWSEPLIVDTSVRQVMVADDGMYLYISYLKRLEVNGLSDYQIYVAVSADHGRTFGAGKNLSGPTGISDLDGDEERPIPWVWDGNNVFNLSGVEADGVHAWNGKNGNLWNSVFLGAGVLAAPARNAFVWEGPNTTVMYGHCE
jgi:hypothetical protein